MFKYILLIVLILIFSFTLKGVSLFAALSLTAIGTLATIHYSDKIQTGLQNVPVIGNFF